MDYGHELWAWNKNGMSVYICITWYRSIMVEAASEALSGETCHSICIYHVHSKAPWKMYYMLEMYNNGNRLRLKFPKMLTYA